MNRSKIFASLFTILLVCLSLTSGLAAQEGSAPGTGVSEQVEQGVHPTIAAEPKTFFESNFVHLMPHKVWGEGLASFYDVNLFQLIALGLILVLFLPAMMGGRGWMARVFRGWIHWLRDEVIYRTMGEEEGKRFTPFFVYLFFFILGMNVLGLIPGSVTATATVFVTGSLALVTFAIMVGGGMLRQGPGNYIKHLVPGGIPSWLLPLMAVVELIGLFVKPFALMIRLFANLLAGHLLIYSFMGMIFVFAQVLSPEDGAAVSGLTWVPAVLTAAMAIFINIIEAFVVLLQAYIFMFLSVMFVQDSLHPAH